MTVSGRYILMALGLLMAVFAAPGAAFADCVGCNRPPVGCRQNCNPTPPPPPPCHNCRPPQIIVPPPYVPPPSIVVVGAGAHAQASATSIAIANVRAGDVVVRTGGGYIGGSIDAGVSGMALAVAEAAVETQSFDRMLALQAICLDDTGTPHPASQVFGERDVREGYAGEIYRCMAGTRMRYTMDGRSYDCARGEALWHENGVLTCRPQIARRPCNERSLLRRFGPGEKMVRVRETRQVARETQFNAQMTMDGGVGQSVW